MKFRTKVENWGDEWIEEDAIDAIDAAEAAAEDYSRVACDYHGPVLVEVEGHGTYSVEFEYEPVFRATLKASAE